MFTTLLEILGGVTHDCANILDSIENRTSSHYFSNYCFAASPFSRTVSMHVYKCGHNAPLHSDSTDPVKKNRRIRNKWLVAYTLIHNPSIRPLRASQLHAQHRHVEAGKADVNEELNPYEVTTATW